MNFQKLLANKEYTVHRRTESFLYVTIGFNDYVFHSQKNEIQCFYIQAFKTISSLDFYEQNYSMSHQELIDLENSELSVNLQFEFEPLAIILGKCLKLKNIESVKPENIINEDSLRFIKDFSESVPQVKWKFSVPEQYYYFIPSTEYCIKFNSNTFFQYGDGNVCINKGEINNIYFLSPYTMFEYYSHMYPNKKRDSLFIGRPIKTADNLTIVIRGTKKELLRAFTVFCELNHLPFTIEHDRIELHVVTHKFSNFFNRFQPALFNALKSDYSYFSNKTNFNVDYNNSIIIKPKKVQQIRYPIVSFVNDSSRLQIIIEKLLNDLYPEKININNITYKSLALIDHEQSDFEEIPNDAITEE